MTEFNLELAKQGKSIKTRCGYAARIICFDRKCYNNAMPVVVLVDKGEGYENVEIYTEKGEYYAGRESKMDLIMV